MLKKHLQAEETIFLKFKKLTLLATILRAF